MDRHLSGSGWLATAPASGLSSGRERAARRHRAHGQHDVTALTPGWMIARSTVLTSSSESHVGAQYTPSTRQVARPSRLDFLQTPPGAWRWRTATARCLPAPRCGRLRGVVLEGPMGNPRTGSGGQPPHGCRCMLSRPARCRGQLPPGFRPRLLTGRLVARPLPHSGIITTVLSASSVSSRSPCSLTSRSSVLSVSGYSY